MPLLNKLITPLLLVLVAGLLAVASRHIGYEADWSSSGRNSLTAGSMATLAAMDQPLTVQAYASDERELRELISRFVDRYRKHKADMALEFRNPLLVVDEARNLGIRVNGELVLTYNNRIEHVYTASEQAFTQALQRLLRGGQRWVYFLEGHGERNPLSAENHDYKTWAETLAAHGIRAQPFDLSHTKAVPHNAAALVIASPLSRLAAAEVQLILGYLEDGGNLLWLSEPGEAANLDALLDYLSVEKRAGVIIDASTQLLGIDSPTIAVIGNGNSDDASNSNYPPHPATADFGLTTYFPKAAAWRPRAEAGWTAKVLLQTGELSWLESGSLAGEVEFDQGADIKGPLVLGLALVRARPPGGEGEQRIVLIGDGDFLANRYANSGNAQLGLRLVTWLIGDDQLITLGNGGKTDTALDMDKATLGLIGLFYLALLPGACCLTGAILWWRRKRL